MQLTKNTCHTLTQTPSNARSPTFSRGQTRFGDLPPIGEGKGVEAPIETNGKIPAESDPKGVEPQIKADQAVPTESDPKGVEPQIKPNQAANTVSDAGNGDKAQLGDFSASPGTKLVL